MAALCVSKADLVTALFITQIGLKPRSFAKIELVEASWAEAISLVAEKFSAAKKDLGSDALGVLSSARCTNEENYLMNKLTRAVFGTNNIDHCARL